MGNFEKVATGWVGDFQAAIRGFSFSFVFVSLLAHVHVDYLYALQMMVITHFNFYYSNGTDVGGGSAGANSITGSTVTFKAEESGTASSGSQTTDQIIYDSSKSWTKNQWQGAAIRLTSGGLSGEWAGIVSNTSDRLYFAPALSGDADGCSYEITEFYVTGTISNDTPLG